MTIEENCKQAGYDVCEVVQIKKSPIKGHAVVLGVKDDGRTYATWEYNEWSGLYWGHYDIRTSVCEAHIKFYERVIACYRGIQSERY